MGHRVEGASWAAAMSAMCRANTMGILPAIMWRILWATSTRYHRTRNRMHRLITTRTMRIKIIASPLQTTINRIWGINRKCPNSRKTFATLCSTSRQASMRRKCCRMSTLDGNRWPRAQPSLITCHNCRRARCPCRCTIFSNTPAKASRKR